MNLLMNLPPDLVESMKTWFNLVESHPKFRPVTNPRVLKPSVHMPPRDSGIGSALGVPRLPALGPVP